MPRSDRIEEARLADLLLEYVLGRASEVLKRRDPASLPVLTWLAEEARRLALEVEFELTLEESGL